MCNCSSCVARIDREFWAIVAANYDVAACYRLVLDAENFAQRLSSKAVQI